MDPNTVVLEISSDEDVGWNDHSGSGISNGGDDHNWLTELLDEVNKESKGHADSDEVVVVVSEEKPLKKMKLNLKASLVDLDDDCVVLDHDPNEPMKARNDNLSKEVDDDSDDIVVVSEKGQVACRDYAHPRHLCIKFPFSTTPNQSHCEQCYCYVCDSLAPCVYWGNGGAITDHCHATDKDEFWILERKTAKSGNKALQSVHKDESFLNQVGVQRPVPTMVQSHNQFPRLGSIHPPYTSANIQPPNNINLNVNHILGSRNKVHPDLVPQFMLRRHQNATTANRNSNLRTPVNRPVFKGTKSARVATTANRGLVGVATTANRGSVGVATTANRGAVGVATTANRNSNGSYRGIFGNPSRQQNYVVNGTPSRPNKYVASSQPHTVNTSVPYSLQSQNYTSSTVYPPPLPPQPQFSNHPNSNIQSQVNSNSFPENPPYQLHLVSPSSSQPQLASSQSSYMVPAQPSNTVPSQTQVHSPSVPVLDSIQNFSQGNQTQGPVTDAGFKNYGLGLPSGQGSTTLEGVGSTNKSSLAGGPDGLLTDFAYDWIFDNQPVEPGFMDITGQNGLNNYSTDSAFLETGPIFEF